MITKDIVTIRLKFEIDLIMSKLLRLLELLPLILKGRANPGYCPICMKKTIFIKFNPWLRDHYKCISCDSIPRHRALLNAMNLFYPKWKEANIHESSPGGVNSDYIRSNCQNYSFSYFFPEVDPGSCKNGARCESLEGMTYEDNSFDIIITQDVLEHVVHPDKVFKEIARVLKPGGLHIFTVPFYRDLNKTRPRITEDHGEICYILEPLFHVNPIDEKGSLVTYDYGLDLPELIHQYSKMKTTIYLQKDRYLGLEGEFLEVFISYN